MTGEHSPRASQAPGSPQAPAPPSGPGSPPGTAAEGRSAPREAVPDRWIGPDPVLEVFGRRVRDFRTAAGLSQRLLAERVGLTRASISNIEAGFQDATVRRLLSLAHALDTTPAALLVAGLESAEVADARTRDRMRQLEAENERLRRLERRVRAALDQTEETPMPPEPTPRPDDVPDTTGLRERLIATLVAHARRETRKKEIKLSSFLETVIRAGAESRADAVLPVVEAALTERAEEAERQRDEALAAVQRVRDLAHDMRNITGARAWAERLDAALDQPDPITKETR